MNPGVFIANPTGPACWPVIKMPETGLPDPYGHGITSLLPAFYEMRAFKSDHSGAPDPSSVISHTTGLSNSGFPDAWYPNPSGMGNNVMASSNRFAAFDAFGAGDGKQNSTDAERLVDRQIVGRTSSDLH